MVYPLKKMLNEEPLTGLLSASEAKAFHEMAFVRCIESLKLKACCQPTLLPDPSSSLNTRTLQPPSPGSVPLVPALAQHRGTRAHRSLQTSPRPG